MAMFQFLRAGVVVNIASFADDAVLSGDGLSVQTATGTLHAPAGEIIMSQSGAGVGWRLANGALVGPEAALTFSELRTYAFAKAAALRGVLRTYALTGGLSVISDATTSTGVDLQGLMVWGQANNAATTNWVDDNGGVVTLTGVQCVALAYAVLAYGQSVFAILSTAMNGIANQTITATAQIDTLSWPT